VSPFSLAGKTALVTGANTGIGQAIALAMGRAGASVICAGRQSCAETVRQMTDARELLLDFADPMAARDVFSNERIDILVNNAGIIRRNDAVDFTESDWDDVLDVNLKAVFFTCQAFGARFLRATEQVPSSTSRLFCRCRAGSGFRPTQLPSTGLRASPSCSPMNGRRRASM
jgi:2-deoxy-D-gluconate 3-dehydrogenase